MTQEELVEVCNVSVRTIQRIESGDVTPRVSTIKIIIAALGEELDMLQGSVTTAQSVSDLSKVESWLQIAWISGIVAFVLGFIDSGIEMARMESGVLDMPLLIYLSIKLSSVTSYIFFIIGLAVRLLVGNISGIEAVIPEYQNNILALKSRRNIV